MFKIVFDLKKEYTLIKKRGYIFAQNKMRKTHEKRAQDLYNTAIYLKGGFIKACQYISARPDAFPEPYIKTLSRLQDDVPPDDFKDIIEVIRSEYGDYTRFFNDIDKDAIASASLAQVHKATLKNGQVVILKILKPDVERIVDVDFAILFHVTRLMSHLKIFRERPEFRSFMNNIMQDFVEITGNELNFEREADTAIYFKEQFKKFNFLKIPYVYKELSTRKVIVMEYLEGDKIYDIDKWKKRNNDPQLIAQRLIEIYVDQFLFSKMIHYDPHPGNIIITDNSNIILLDFGMAGEISEKMRNGFWLILEAAVIKDFRKIIDVLDDLGFIQKDYNKYSLLPIIEFFFDNILDVVRLDREAIFSIDYSPIRDDLLAIIDSHVFNLPPNWAFSGKTFSTLYGIISILNPDFKIYSEVKKTAFKVLRNNLELFLNEIATRIFDALKSNIFKLLTLPGKMDSFIDNIEQGNYRFRMDDKDIIKKVDEVQVSIFKMVFFILSLFSGVAGYVYYIDKNPKVALVLGIVSGTLLLISLVYKKRTLKDELRKQMEKMF